jgi:hypothetical protein
MDPWASNTAYYASNTAYYGSNTARFASNTANYASNTVKTLSDSYNNFIAGVTYGQNGIVAEDPWSRQTAVFASNLGIWCSNQIDALYEAIDALDTSGTGTTFDEAKLEWTSNAVDELIIEVQGASEDVLWASNAVENIEAQTLWASNAVDWSSNTVDWSSNTVDWSSNTVDWSSNTVDWSSNTVDWASNQIDTMSQQITTAQADSEWCSNLLDLMIADIALTSNVAFWASNALENVSHWSFVESTSTTECNINIGPADIFATQLNVNARDATSPASFGLYNAANNFVIIESGTTSGNPPAITFGSTDPAALVWNASESADPASRVDQELMRLTTDGKLGINTTVPQETLHVIGNIHVEGNVQTTGGILSLSDERLKTNITAADTSMCYDIVKSVELRQFEMDFTVTGANTATQYGWLAQDLEGQLPEAVTQKTMFDLEDCRLLRADQVYAVMFGAIQQLQQKIEALEDAVATLQGAQ